MPLRYPYADAYLAREVTQPREDRAAADVALLGTLPARWVERLVQLRTYVITCTECMKSDNDMFAAKLAAYRKDYNDSVPQARAAQQAAEAAAGNISGGAGFSYFSIPIERA